MRSSRAIAAALAAGLLYILPASRAGAESTEEAVDRVTKSALALDAHRQRGAALYAQTCAKCHGSKGYGDPSRLIPALAGQRFAYLVRQLANFAGDERDSAAMHRIVAQVELRDPQAWIDLAAFLNAAPPGHLPATGHSLHLVRGQALFLEQCASCHRADAGGDDAGFVPSLRNQHYVYLAAQISRLGDGARHNVDENLVRFLGGLEPADVDALADYLSRLRGRGDAHSRMRPDGVVVD